MKKFLVILSAMFLVFGVVGQAKATITSSNPAVAITQDFDMKYLDWGGAVLPTTLIEKEFSNLDPITTTITYGSDDFDYVNGFGNLLRTSEWIYNDTGEDWTDYHLTISDGAGIFIKDTASTSTDTVPAQYERGLDGVYTIDLIPNPLENKPSISPDQRTLWFDFSDPIADGTYLFIHVPIGHLDSNGGSFTLTQHPTVPEPATLLLLGTGLLGLAGLGRKKFFVK